MVDTKLAEEARFPKALHFQITTDLDNIGQFVGQRVNAEDATYVALESDDYHHLQKLAVDGRLAILVYAELRKILKKMFELMPDCIRTYYAASLSVMKENDRTANSVTQPFKELPDADV